MREVQRRGAGLWATVEDRIDLAGPPEDAAAGTVFDAIERRIDPALFRPKLAPDIEIKVFRLGEGRDYAMIANPRGLIHYRVEGVDIPMLELMDGTRTVKEIVLERFQESGELELDEIASFIQTLYSEGFFVDQYVNVDRAVERAMNPVSIAREKARTFGKTLTIEWKNPDPFVRWSHRHVLRYILTKRAQIVMAVVAAVGFAAFLRTVSWHRYHLTGKSLALGFLILLALDCLAIFCHEMAHAVMLTHFGRKVKAVGAQIYFGSLAFLVDNSDILMLDRKQRMLDSIAGPYAQFTVAGVTSLLVWAFPNWAIAPTLFKFAILNNINVMMNLIPMLELDGYWLFSEAIGDPDLRKKSLSFVRYDLVHKLREREKFSRREVGWALYGTIGSVFTILAFYVSFFYWKNVFGGLVSTMWHSGVATRVLLIALGLFVFGPVLRGVVKLILALWRRIVALWERVRFRLERSWRIEAATLVDALPLFDDVPEDVLSELAGRVRLRTFAYGQPVVRQGERPEAFFVVRKGEFEVVEEDPDTGDERVLRQLARGDSFGELALVTGATRAATVRGAGPSGEVFEVDKGTFDRLLSDMIRVPDFAPTLKELAELRELPTFSHLQHEELLQLLEEGEWITVAPSETIIEQGDVGDAFYAIGSGQVEVRKDGEVVRTLGSGSFFGEIALLYDVPRTAAVVATTPVRVFRLRRTGFDRLVAHVFKGGQLRTNVTVARPTAR